MPEQDLPRVVLGTTARILRPLIRILLRHGITYSAFSELSKRLYFDVVKTDFALPGKKQTTSRISTLTGLSRKEVARLDATTDDADPLDTSTINRAARVISGWVRDPEFHDEHGAPANLPFEGERSFTALVKKYSGDITARTITDELTRVNAISVIGDGLLQLNTHAYVPNHSEVEKLTILGTDVADLIDTIDHNLTQPDQAYFQRKVAYNYIPADTLAQLKTELAELAQNNLEAMDSVLSSKAIDKQKAKKKTQYIRVGVGVYYFEQEQS